MVGVLRTVTGGIGHIDGRVQPTKAVAPGAAHTVDFIALVQLEGLQILGMGRGLRDRLYTCKLVGNEEYGNFRLTLCVGKVEFGDLNPTLWSVLLKVETQGCTRVSAWSSSSSWITFPL